MIMSGSPRIHALIGFSNGDIFVGSKSLPITTGICVILGMLYSGGSSIL